MEFRRVLFRSAASLGETDCFYAEASVSEDQFLLTTEPEEPPIAGMDSHQIRSLWCVVNDTQVAECILDGGSQIAAISEACCHRLKITVDPLVNMHIRSANGSLDGAVGLARDVPIQLTPKIVGYLQLFVIRNAAYDVLLG